MRQTGNFSFRPSNRFLCRLDDWSEIRLPLLQPGPLRLQPFERRGSTIAGPFGLPDFALSGCDRGARGLGFAAQPIDFGDRVRPRYVRLFDFGL